MALIDELKRVQKESREEFDELKLKDLLELTDRVKACENKISTLFARHGDTGSIINVEKNLVINEKPSDQKDL
jgi:hypothetical protein